MIHSQELVGTANKKGSCKPTMLWKCDQHIGGIPPGYSVVLSFIWHQGSLPMAPLSFLGVRRPHHTKLLRPTTTNDISSGLVPAQKLYPPHSQLVPLSMIIARHWRYPMTANGSQHSASCLCSHLSSCAFEEFLDVAPFQTSATRPWRHPVWGVSRWGRAILSYQVSLNKS